MTEYKKRIWLYLFMFLMSSLALEAKNLPFYNGGFEIWESYLLTNFNKYTDMPSGWDLTTNSYPVDLRKEDNYHTNPYPPRQGQYALYYFDTSFNRPIKTKGYTLSEGTYTYSVYASTMGWTNTYITLTVEGDITTSKKMAVNGSWSKYSITFTLEETATVYFGIDNKKTYDGNGTISHFIVDDCSLQTTDGNLICTQYDYTSNENANFAYYLYSSGEAELVKCNNKDISGKIEIPSTVTKDGTTYKIRTISCNAFENCSNISEIVLPAYLYEIGTEAFKNCSSLKTLVVSNRVTSISANAFAECNRLEDIELFAKERVKFESNSFPANSNLCLYVPNVDDYNSLTTFSVKSLAYVNSLVEYNGRNPILTYTFAPGVSATGIDLNDLSPNVGTYNLPATFTHTSGLKVNGYITFNIEKKALNVKADDIERIYGNNNPPLKISYSGFVNNEDESVLTAKPTVGTTATKTSNVGEYPITVSGGSAKNYIFGYEPGTLTITKAPLTAKVNDVTRQYGQDNPAFTINYTGLKNGETVPKWEEALKIETTATKTSDVGNYDITATGIPTNYSLTTTKGLLSITQAPLTIKADNTTRKYFETEPSFTYSCSGFLNGDNVDVLTKAPSFNTDATKTSNVGKYKITPSGAEAKNYTMSYEQGELTITKRQLTATSHCSRFYGEDNPSLPIEYDGFVNGETEEVLSEKPMGTTTATKTSSVGEYPITISGGEATNYDFVYEQGVLTVAKASLSAEVKDTTKVYGTQNPSFSIEYYGLKNGETVPAWTTAPTFQTEATKASGVGEYAIKAINGVPVNYDIEIADGTLSITPASLTIKANDATRLYYSDDPAFSYKCNGFVNGDDESVLISTPTLSTSATRESKVGTYEIKVGETSCSNYSISYVNGTLTITPCTLVASVGNYERKYNEENPVFEVKYDGFVGNEDESSLLTKPQATTTATKTSDVGTYPITLAGGSADNYSFSYTSGVLTVNKAEQTIEWDQNLIGVRKGEQIKLTAKTLSGLPISYTSENSSIAEVYSSGNDFYLDCKAEGETQILALQAGNKNYFASQKIRKTVSVTINKYKLIYMVDGELYKTVTYELGATITPEPAPTKEGYTFSGWSGVPEIMPDYDVTVTGSFSPNQYTITYMIDGKQYGKETVAFGSKIEPPTPPSKEGYHFVWYEYPETMPAYDITINGSYIENITLTITSKGKGIVTYNDETIQDGTSIFTVEEGSSAIINFTPNPGYIVKSVKLNSDDVTILLSNGQYTISNIRENQIVEAEFIGDIINMADADVNYSVISYEEQTVMVTAGNYGNVLTVPASFTAKEKTWTVVGIDEDALKDNTTLAAIVWNPEVAFTAKVSNPNLLLYVKDAQYAPATIQNVVVNNQAENIVLVEAASGNDFYCPQAFTAKRISYEHNYSMISGYKTCQGWETLVLPFDVTMMINAKGQELTPYINWQYGNSQRPFWLYEMTTQGWKAGSAIKANTPYIISMPNNEMYDVSFKQTGNIQFIGTNVEVKASTEMKTGQHGNKRLVANYQTQEASADIYALNVSNEWSQNTAMEVEGSTFIRSLRSVHPFEAYLTVEGSNAPLAIPLFENMPTGINEKLIVNSEKFATATDWYTIDGRKLQDEPKQNGIYIIKGKKVRK